MARRWRLVAHHVRCGMHSGFPPCCVMFFLVRIYTWWPAHYYRNNTLAGRIERALVKPRGVNYIQCPLCQWRDHRVPLKRCSCSIKEYLR